MAVRRLAEVQPESFAFSDDNSAWASQVIAKFPEGRQASAVIPLLWRAQEQEGWVTKPAIEGVAAILGMPEIRVLEVATFYTMFHLEPVGAKAHVQVCGTTPCMLRGSDDIIAVCRERIAHHPHERSTDGAFSWEEVECLGACVNAPMVQIGRDNYEDLTVESFNALLDAFERGERPQPGPQNGRWTSTPVTGLTTLTEIAYADDDVPPGDRQARSGSAEQAEAGRAAGDTAPKQARDAAADISGGEQGDAERARRTGAGIADHGAGSTPEAANQNIGRVDASGRSDEAASDAMASGGAGQADAHAAPVRDDDSGKGRSGEDRGAQPRSGRDSATGDREGGEGR